MIPENNIGTVIADACRQKDLSYYRLAKQSGIPLTTIMHIVDGNTKNPGFYTIATLCRILELSMDDVCVW